MSTWGPDTGWKDTFVRAAKTAVATFIGVAGANVVGWTNVSGLEAAGVAAGSAAATVILNKILSWTNS